MNRHLRSTVVAGMAVGMAVVGIALALPAWAAATTNAAFWSMDEPAGSSVMSDNSGQGLHGRVGADVQTGTLFGGSTGYRFPDISPTAPPARPEHLVTVPHTTRLNPESADYSVTVRYRTTKSFGNIAQKGQNATVGGYWKFEQPNGKVACLFKGSGGGQRTAWSLTALNDGQWHTVKCERTATAVSMYVDGVRHSRNPGWTGPIANTWEMSVGGKSRCDQIRTTCDYFVGDIDYVRVEKGSAGPANQPPVPSLATECSGMVCSLSAAGSTDADGAIQSYAWNFGDGSSVDTGSVRSTTHTYAAAGTYPVTLTVTDDRGVSRSTSAPVTVAPAAERISFVGQATTSGNLRTHAVTVPASVQPGDGLVLFFSENTHATIAEPTGVTGWVPLHQMDGGYATSRVWRKVAGPGDAGTMLRVTLSAQSKGVLTVAAYRGTDASDPVAAYAAATDTAPTASRVTPTVTVPVSGAWALSYWMHGDSSSTALTPPPGVTVRAGASQTGGGRVTTLLADSGAGLPTGSYGGLTATGAATGTTTTTWTVVLHPQG